MNRLHYLLLLFVFTNSCLYSNIKKEASIKSASFFVQKKDTLLLKQYQQAKVLYKNKEFDTALKLSLEILELSKDAELGKIEYLTNILIAKIFKETNNKVKSLKYSKLALKVQSKVRLDDNKLNFREFFLAENLLMIAGAYQDLGQIDSSKFYYNRLLQIKSLNKEMLAVKARAYVNLSGMYLQQSFYEKSKYFAKEAVKIHLQQKNNLALSGAYSNLASIYLKENKLEKAKEYYFKAIRLVENNKNLKAIKNKELFYDNLAFTLYNQKNYIAYDYLEKSFIIRDSLREVEVRDILTEIEAKHNYDNERKINVAKREQARFTFIIYAVVALIIIISLLFWLNYYQLKQKNLKLKLSQTELIKENEIENLKSEVQARILNATLDGKEKERKKIAEILHDNVSALLSSANLHLQASTKQFKGELPSEIVKTQQIINDASKKIRDLSHTLVSAVLLKFGLTYASKDMAKMFSNSQLKIVAELEDLPRYAEDFEMKIYNIIHELMNNILKHSDARNATISLSETDGILRIVISDNGKGFDMSHMKVKGGVGINQIEARVHMLKGTFRIISKEGMGTKVKINVPVEKKELIHG